MSTEAELPSTEPGANQNEGEVEAVKEEVAVKEESKEGSGGKEEEEAEVEVEEPGARWGRTRTLDSCDILVFALMLVWIIWVYGSLLQCAIASVSVCTPFIPVVALPLRLCSSPLPCDECLFCFCDGIL